MNPTQLLQYATSSAEYFLSNRTAFESIDGLDGYLIEDVVQDSIMKLLKSKVKPQTKTYVANTVWSVIIDLSRRNKLPRLTSDLQVADETVVPLLSDSETIQGLIDTLDTEDTNLFVQYHQTNLNIHDIAVLHAVSERTIKRRLSELSDIIQDFLCNHKES